MDRMDGQIGEWTGWMDRWVNGLDGRMDRLVNGQMSEWIGWAQISECTQWMDRWVNG